MGPLEAQFVKAVLPSYIGKTVLLQVKGSLKACRLLAVQDDSVHVIDWTDGREYDVDFAGMIAHLGLVGAQLTEMPILFYNNEPLRRIGTGLYVQEERWVNRGPLGWTPLPGQREDHGTPD